MGWQIAIDGPAGAGKSTIAQEIAKRLDFMYLDTGAMYRAITLKALNLGVNLDNEDDFSFVKDTKIEFKDRNVLLDGRDVTKEIRSVEVTNNASLVSKYGLVRTELVRLQRELASSKNVIMDGRDIGTIVLPNANLKIFLNANVVERARRRILDKGAGEFANQDLLTTVKDLQVRDFKDSHRQVSPLKKANDAVEIDTTGLSVEEVIEEIVSLVIKRGYENGKRS